MATKKRSLGTGLDSLFGADTVTVEKEPTATLPLTKLEPRQEQPRNYFDEEAWKSDARMDGRGHIISRYDGCENEEKVNGTWYYIFRQN